jgi:hypothetical protein
MENKKAYSVKATLGTGRNPIKTIVKATSVEGAKLKARNLFNKLGIRPTTLEVS